LPFSRLADDYLLGVDDLAEIADREERNPLHYLYDNLTSEVIAKLSEELPAKFFCTETAEQRIA
jgi:hypothetical protein